MIVKKLKEEETCVYALQKLHAKSDRIGQHGAKAQPQHIYNNKTGRAAILRLCAYFYQNI